MWIQGSDALLMLSYNSKEADKILCPWFILLTEEIALFVAVNNKRELIGE